MISFKRKIIFFNFYVREDFSRVGVFSPVSKVRLARLAVRGEKERIKVRSCERSSSPDF